MKYITFLILSVFLSVSLSYGQKAETEIDTTTDVKYKNSIGGVAGYTVGLGLAYKRMFNKFAVQVSFAPYKDEEYSSYNAAFSFYYNLVEASKINFFVYQGNHYIYNEYFEYEWNKTNDIIDKKTVIESYWNNGLGIGIEIIILKRVGLDLMAGYASYDNYKRISFTGEIGIGFMF